MLNKITDIRFYYLILGKYRYWYVLYCLLWNIVIVLVTSIHGNSMLFPILFFNLLSWFFGYIASLGTNDKISLIWRIKYNLLIIFVLELLTRVFLIIYFLTEYFDTVVFISAFALSGSYGIFDYRTIKNKRLLN
jgi:hypothetical protein